MSSDLEKGFHQKSISFWPNSVWFTHQYNSWCCWCACRCHTREAGNDTCEATNETSRHKSTSELLICHWPLYRLLTAGCISGCFFQSLLPGVANYFKLCLVGSVCSARLPVWSGSITCNFIFTKIPLHWDDSIPATMMSRYWPTHSTQSRRVYLFQNIRFSAKLQFTSCSYGCREKQGPRLDS